MRYVVAASTVSDTLNVHVVLIHRTTTVPLAYVLRVK
jgi:hypothetical protein